MLSLPWHSCRRNNGQPCQTVPPELGIECSLLGMQCMGFVPHNTAWPASIPTCQHACTAQHARPQAHLAGRGLPVNRASASAAAMRSSGSGSSKPSTTASKRAPIFTAGMQELW